MAAAAFSSLDPEVSHLHLVFAGALSLLAISLVAGALNRPRLRVSRQVGAVGRAGLPLAYRIHLQPEAPRVTEDLVVDERLPPGFTFPEPATAPLAIPPEGTTLSLTLLPARRGVYRLPGPVVASTWPFGMLRFGAMHPDPARVVIQPRTFPIPRLAVPIERRHQPGGIPLASVTGESCEFLSTREYREGDSLRSIHWRSWARLGTPVVVEYQEEYFCRLGVILDTFARSRRDLDRLEAAVTTAASLIEAIADGEQVLDLFISGNTIHRTGRHLSDPASILEVLACVEATREAPVQGVQAHVMECLDGLSCLMVVLLSLDAPRQAFLRRLQSRGTPLRVFLIGEPGTGEWDEVELPTDLEALGARLARL